MRGDGASSSSDQAGSHRWSGLRSFFSDILRVDNSRIGGHDEARGGAPPLPPLTVEGYLDAMTRLSSHPAEAGNLTGPALQRLFVAAQAHGLFGHLAWGDLLTNTRPEVIVELADSLGPIDRVGLMNALQASPIWRHLFPVLLQMTRSPDVAAELILARFGVQLTAANPARPWDLAGLQRIGAVLQELSLHNDHVAQLVAQGRLTTIQRSDGTGGGVYTHPTISLGYQDAGAPEGLSEAGDPLFGVNSLDRAALHEIGHAVEEMLDYSDTYGVPGWQLLGVEQVIDAFLAQYGDPALAPVGLDRATLRAVLVALFDGGPPSSLENIPAALGPAIALARSDEETWAGYEAAILAAFRAQAEQAEQEQERELTDAEAGELMGSVYPLAARLRDILPPQNEPPGQAPADGAMSLDALATLEIVTRLMLAKDAWRLADGGEGVGLRVGDRIYQYNATNKEWSSYLVADRPRKVSLYQFKSQQEWFAEAYATYYMNRPGLEQRDPAAFDFFRDYVQPLLPYGGGQG